ncbi:MAG TPA: gliding motility-associated C-terminal domain-containing protein [Edaphocola sp.]|nr:gliding motility-associated C-terminal domain-containing protein [Edaphocola sp.]
MKIGYKNLLSLCILLILSNITKAQIALSVKDTTICRGGTVTMSASVTGQVGNISQDDIYNNAITNIGFPFQFYGNTYTQCVISANGYISFDLTKVGMFSNYNWNSAINSTDANNMIAVGFQDLWPTPANGGSIRFQTFGAPGSRRFVVEYCDIAKYGSSCSQFRVTQQMILYETSNVIEFHVTSLPGTPSCPGVTPGEAVQGIRWVNGATINQLYTPNRGPGQNWGATGATNSATRYTPMAGTPFYTIDTTIAFNPWKIIENINNPLLKWYDAQGNFVHQGASYTVTLNTPPPPATGTFFVVDYSGPAGCSTPPQNFTFKDTVFIHFQDVKTYMTESMCAGQTYDFYGKTLFNPGVYDTVFKTMLGCDSTIILTLNINPLPDAEILSGSKEKMCQGETYVFRAKKGAGYQYQWKRNGANIAGANQDTYEALLAGKYTVEVTSNLGCKQLSKTVELVIAPNPTIKINYVSSYDICAGDTITINASATGENIEYVWSPAEYFWRTPGSQTFSNVKAIVPHSGYIYVRAINNDLCNAYDSIFVKAEPCCDMPMPNAFTPNKDGVNDYFVPSLNIGQQIVFFQVYDRYGHLVFESNGAGREIRGWDGLNLKGKMVNAGVYNYVLRYTCSDKKIHEKTGDVILMK